MPSANTAMLYKISVKLTLNKLGQCAKAKGTTKQTTSIDASGQTASP